MESKHRLALAAALAAVVAGAALSTAAVGQAGRPGPTQAREPAGARQPSSVVFETGTARVGRLRDQGATSRPAGSHLPQLVESARIAGGGRGGDGDSTVVLTYGLSPMATIPLGTLATVMEAANADMTGWTAATNGASPNGPEIVFGKLLLVRGADGVIYGALVNPAGPLGAVDSASWRSLATSTVGEFDCRASAYSVNAAFASCASLGAGGSATAFHVAMGTATSFGGSATEVLGGSNAGGRPAVIQARPQYSSSLMAGLVGYESNGLTVAVPGPPGTLFTNIQTEAISEAAIPPAGAKIVVQLTKPGPWTSAAVPIRGAMSCSEARCAWRTPSGEIAIGTTSGTVQLTNPGPGGGGAVEILVGSDSTRIIARGAGGRVFSAAYSPGLNTLSPWRDEGGYVSGDSNISCTSAGATPACYIRGPDGRIYWRRISSAGGL